MSSQMANPCSRVPGEIISGLFRPVHPVVTTASTPEKCKSASTDEVVEPLPTPVRRLFRRQVGRERREQRDGVLYGGVFGDVAACPDDQPTHREADGDPRPRPRRRTAGPPPRGRTPR